MKLVMSGALGRMGIKIIKLASDDPDIQVTGAVEYSGHPAIGRDIGDIIGIGALGVPVTDDLRGAAEKGDVVVDFSLADAMLNVAEICGKTGTPLVEGTTGLGAEDREVFEKYVSAIPCVFAPNMSVGVNLLFKLAGETAAILGDDYDIEITEVHHRFKKDAPSGTANKLAEIIAGTLDRDLDNEARYGREGFTGERTQKEIGIHALRIGDVVGEHTVSFGTPGERIELVHKTQSREALAKGALRAVHFVVQAAPGLYDMQDVLGLK